MANPAIKHQKYSYADYLEWNDDKRWEIINGEVYDMSPAPNTKHQKVLGNLFLKIANYLKGKKCKVFVAPFDVRLAKQSDEDFEIINVVQPDISVFCDKKKIDSKGAKGAPDWIIEILSPFTSKKDLSRKLVLYMNYQVKEYWMVDPEDESVLVFVLNEQKTFSDGTEYKKKQSVPVNIFPNFKIKVTEIFMS